MADLISRQAAIDSVNILHGGCITDDVKAFVRYQILSVPTTDMAEVVRCKDCKYAKMGECEHKLGLIVANDENYCSYGVRKDDQPK